MLFFAPEVAQGLLFVTDAGGHVRSHLHKDQYTRRSHPGIAAAVDRVWKVLSAKIEGAGLTYSHMGI
jgi:hypothetical protein